MTNITRPALTQAEIDAANRRERDAKGVARAATIAPQISEWTNPRTGEVRRYINNVGEIFASNYNIGKGSAYLTETGELESTWKYVVNERIVASLRAHGITVDY